MKDPIEREDAIEVVKRQRKISWDKWHETRPSAERIIEDLKELPSAQPERPEQDILAWLLAYHMKSFDLKGRYMAHEVIGWLVHDFATAYMAERREE